MSVQKRTTRLREIKILEVVKNRVLVTLLFVSPRQERMRFEPFALPAVVFATTCRSKTDKSNSYAKEKLR